MSPSSHPVERFSFSTALFGMLVLTLGMGLGRFLYTPMLPVMLAEGTFHLTNYRGLPAATTLGIWLEACCFHSAHFIYPHVCARFYWLAPRQPAC